MSVSNPPTCYLKIITQNRLVKPPTEVSTKPQVDSKTQPNSPTSSESPVKLSQQRRSSPIVRALTETSALPQRSSTPVKGTWSSLFTGGSVRNLLTTQDKDTATDTEERGRSLATKKRGAGSTSILNKETFLKASQSIGRKLHLDTTVVEYAAKPAEENKPTFSDVVKAPNPAAPEKRQIKVIGDAPFKDR